jgi:hypothetical protein
MARRLSLTELHEILALQLTAWAGEAAGEPSRLGWWKSDLVDREGGGELFRRLVPRTASWASLVLALRWTSNFRIASSTIVIGKVTQPTYSVI